VICHYNLPAFSELESDIGFTNDPQTVNAAIRHDSASAGKNPSLLNEPFAPGRPVHEKPLVECGNPQAAAGKHVRTFTSHFS
jgi:hypothetical protein